MCGLAGLVDVSGRPVDQELLQRMTDALAPRGPDGEGFWFGEGVGLGHRRLAVVDLSPAGRQPMATPDGRVQLVVNGEIYNFPEVRRELEALGFGFRSHCDSEVILNGYLAWGDDVLSHLDGMFAFVIWDAERRHLLAARDRMGKKPLYFATVARDGDAPLFAFASELKSLLLVPGLDRRVDSQSLSEYLAFEYVPAPRSIVRGAKKLDAAECLTWDVGRTGSAPVVRRYWTLPFPQKHEALSLDDAKAELRRRLSRAVQRRLMADVPVGVFLSGGVDSSTVVALMAAHGGHGGIKTFSMGFAAEDGSFDETSYARAVAQRFGTSHIEERLEPKAMLEVLPTIMGFLDEPLADASIVPTFLLSRFARKHVTVALGGDGGDELFAGYPTFRAEALARQWLDPLPSALRRFACSTGEDLAALLPARSSYFSLDFKVRQFLRGAAAAGPERHQRWLASFLPEEQSALLSRAFQSDLVLDPFAPLHRDRRPASALDPWDELMAFYCRFYLAGDINVKVDRASSAVGLEARAPFLDTDVVSFACSIAPALRMRGTTSKLVLKEAMRDLLPGEILDRPKQGFGVPVSRWLKKELRPWLAEMLSATRLAREGFFEPAVVGQMVDEHTSGRRDHRKRLWTLLVFQSWLERWGS